MLYFGTVNLLQYLRDDVQVFDFYSYTSRFYNLNLVPPIEKPFMMNEYDFDLAYYHWVIDQDCNFCNFMKVVTGAVNGDVFLVISDPESTYSVVLAESFMKILQQRYGINGTIVLSEEDIKYAGETQLNPYYGISNYDGDVARYEYILNSSLVQMYGTPSEF